MPGLVLDHAPCSVAVTLNPKPWLGGGCSQQAALCWVVEVVKQVLAGTCLAALTASRAAAPSEYMCLHGVCCGWTDCMCVCVWKKGGSVLASD